ncbi:hypothetical protein CC80DRAFT_465490 [Byssothecium circinans]|uniref:Uncharacterized protein n=1 Tax=Byssothecium circinans TaxID=147558 RepID=A0A6A5UB50_9PLEO|nr:hypothetical protein CC80DRAFT_465490 [Byssothecium circinans]
MPPSPSPPSRLHRAFPASIFLVLAGICFRSMDIPTFVLKFPPPSASGYISHPHGKTPILQKFHWIGFLDEVFKDITVGFAPASFGYDDVSRWQMFNFMSDIGVIYTIFALEGLRVGIKGGPVWYPAVFMTIAQLGGGGVFVPIYYFCNIIFGLPKQHVNAAEKKIDIAGAWVFLVGILIFHNVPLAGMMLAPTFEERHCWTWLWQLYPLRITIFYYVVIGLRKITPLPTFNIAGYQKNLRLIMAPLILSPAIMWIYTLIQCPYPFPTVFWPQPLSDPNAYTVDSWGERMRRTLVFDQLFVGGSTFLWLAWSAKDVKGLATFGVACAVLLVAVGPGATIGIMWCLREGWLGEGVN